MHIYLKRYSFSRDSTGGLLFIDSNFECYTVEDEERQIKVPGETAIPRGVYEVLLRDEGGMHADYLARYGPEWHKGMLWIMNIPDFKWVYFHAGNDEGDTEGCPLVGSAINTFNGEDVIPPGKSREAYEKFYPKVRDAILKGERVLLHVEKINAI